MPKRTNHDEGFFRVLDLLLTLRRDLESENQPAGRMQMSIDHLDTPMGSVPFIILTPCFGIVQIRAETERATFAQFGAKRPWPEERRRLLESLQGLVEAPIVCLAEAFVRIVLHDGECFLTLGTRGRPRWTNYNLFTPDVLDYLEAMSGIGGILVHFGDPFERSAGLPEPKEEREITRTAIYKRGVGEHVLAMVKRPRERLILMLAIYLHIDPDEINELNLAQVAQKFGRDHRFRVYLKKRLIRKKAVADALLDFRKRDRESFWDPKEPMFRTGKKTPSGRSMRMGSKAIEALIVRYAERALKEIPTESSAHEPAVIPPRPPIFWVSDIQYRRA
jgi:hypothetical protein